MQQVSKPKLRTDIIQSFFSIKAARKERRFQKGNPTMENRSRLVKLGLIGCGNVAESRHLPALQSLQDAEVVAAADINPDRLKQVTDRFHIERRYPDFRALLDDPAIEAVAVCVPAQFHVEVALAALDAGKHLFIEKPLALSLDESDRLIERAAQSPYKVMVGFNMRWHRLVRQAREIVQRRALGPVKSLRSVITSRFRENEPEWVKRRKLGGGVLIELAVHSFDLWSFLLQSEVQEVFAMSRSGRWDDETATVTARMANGVLTSAVFSKGTGENSEMEIYGQNGRLHISNYRFDGLEFLPSSSFPGSVRTRLGRMADTLKELPQAASAIRQGGDFVASYQAEWRHFIDAIRQDTPVESTLEDGRRALQVVLAAVESASLGQPVKVAQASRKITPIATDIPVQSWQNEH
jgi:myo-inositol 2-dehydrogenase/D-chiro-inositol 1-dehydrogenase